MARNQNRRVRRESMNSASFDSAKLDLPGPLRIFANRRLFAILGIIFGVGMIGGLMYGVIGGTGIVSDNGVPQQANEVPDLPANAEGTPVASPTASANAAIKRYTTPPDFTLDVSDRFTATIKTAKGDIQIELYPDQAPIAVNSFVFLAREGYYNNTPFMQLSAQPKNPDGTPFQVLAGDPTRTGLGTPGYSIPKEPTSRPFVRGVVGMGGTAADSNGGQFFIAFGDYPALNGKYTIIGQVTAGLDILQGMSLIDLSTRGSGSGDEIQSITITETDSQPPF
jgi:cyclophilin family peptidyl-prolyl cis-trans isomerase